MILISALAGGSKRREGTERSSPTLLGRPTLRLRLHRRRARLPAARPARAPHQVVPHVSPLYAALVGVKATLGGLRDPDTVIPPDLAEKIVARQEGEGGAGQAAV